MVGVGVANVLFPAREFTEPIACRLPIRSDENNNKNRLLAMNRSPFSLLICPSDSGLRQYLGTCNTLALERPKVQHVWGDGWGSLPGWANPQHSIHKLDQLICPSGVKGGHQLLQGHTSGSDSCPQQAGGKRQRRACS